MSLLAPVENGKVVETNSQNSLSKVNGSSNSMDKDAFLQLLVAQMKYQDPLEPTSNTEYISQYAQFSQVEQMQNMASTTELSRASSLVGQYVYVKTTSSTGETGYVQGKVDYVVYENGKAFLSINESLYALEDLDTIVDEQYMAASDKAYEFTVAMNQLPSVESIELSDGDLIDALQAVYKAMSEYEKQFVASDTVNILNAYVNKLDELRKAAEAAKGNGTEGGNDGGEEPDGEDA